MDKIQRIQAALKGEPVDHVPFCVFFHFPENQRAGAAMAKAHVDYYRAADVDFLKVMNDNFYSPPEFKGLAEPSDWRGLRPAPLSSQRFQDQLSGLKKIAAAVGDEVTIITTVFNPFQSLDRICDWTATRQLKEYPEAVDEGLSTVTESLSGFVRACVEAGADGIYFAAHGGGRMRHSVDEFEKFIKPHDLAVLRAAEDAGAAFNLLHLCGEGLRLEAYADYPAHAVNWAPQRGNSSLSEGRRIFKRTIVGGLDEAGPILTGPRELVVTEVERAIGEVGTRGFILGAGCALTRSVSPERIQWVREAAQARSEL